VQSNQYDLFTHFHELAEDNLKVLNLPTRGEMDDLSKDTHDLKKTVHDLTRKMEALKINISSSSVKIRELTEAENKKKDVIVSIRDTGVGISSEIIDRIFSKFATKSDTGTGLGLFISKSIIEAHGGRIWAENNADGKGATFSFSLPWNN
jgi:signal transduction histidine kinase